MDAPDLCRRFSERQRRAMPIPLRKCRRLTGQIGTYFSVVSYRRKCSSPIPSFRTRGTLEIMTINREKPPIVVQVIVWVGLAILLPGVGAFVWLFMLGHGFNFSF